MFSFCHDQVSGAVVQRCWPDNGAYTDQENLTATLFKVFREQMQAVLNG